MTSIKEEVLEQPINISKFKFTCDDSDATIPKPLPQQGGFAMLIVGKPRSGKTATRCVMTPLSYYQTTKNTRLRMRRV